MIQVSRIVNPFAPMSVQKAVYDEPLTIQQALDLTPMPVDAPFVCQVNGEYVLRSEGWATFVLPQDSLCMFEAVPRGGGGGGGKKNVLALILIIIVLIVVTVVTWGVGTGPLAGGLVGLAGGVGTLGGALVAVGAALVVAGAAYLINMALPPTFPKTPEAPDPVYSIVSRSNQARIGMPIEFQFGKIKAAPSVCTNVFSDFTADITEFSRNNHSIGSQTLYEVYNLGWGEYEIELYEMLDQDVSAYSEVVILKHEPGMPVTAFPTSVKTVSAVAEIELVFASQGPQPSGKATVLEIVSPNPQTGTSSQQRVTITGWISGTCTLGFRGENATLLWNDTIEEVQRKLNLLTTISGAVGGPGTASSNYGAPTGSTPAVLVRGSVTVSGPRTIDRGPFVVAFDGGRLRSSKVPELVLDESGLEEGADTYPNWGTIGAYGEVLLANSGGLEDIEGIGECAWLVDPTAPFGADNSLVDDGALVVFYPEGSSLDDYGDTKVVWAVDRPHQCITNIVKNTADKIWWLAPAGTFLRNPDGTPRLPYPQEETGGDGVPDVSHYHILTLGNWKGPYKINGSQGDDLIDKIGIDIVLPSGHFHTSSMGYEQDICLLWRGEYQAIDEFGDPVDGIWHPITYDQDYIKTLGSGRGGIDLDVTPEPGYRLAANFAVGSHDNSPVRFTLKIPVTAGRYQVRLANVTDIPHMNTMGGGGLIYPVPPEDQSLVGYTTDSSIEDWLGGSSTSMRSYWTSLRGYGVSSVVRWPGRTTITVQAKATDNVNGNTLRQFTVTATRKLRDYVGAVDPGVLPDDPFDTVSFSNVFAYAGVPLEDGRMVRGSSIALGTMISRVEAQGIGDEFLVGDYVRVSSSVNTVVDGVTRNNDGEYMVVKSRYSYVEVIGDLFEEEGLVAGSRRVYSRAPSMLTEVAITGVNTVEATIGDWSDFEIGDEVTLLGFVDAANTVKTVIVDIPIATEITVEATLVVEASSADTRACSAPPKGLVGAVLDGALASFSGATAVGGIAAVSLNTTTVTGVRISGLSTAPNAVVSEDIGLNPAFVVGKTVRLHGFDSAGNNLTAIITEIANDILYLDRNLDWENVLDTAGAPVTSEGQSVTVGERALKCIGDCSFYFYADEGSTSAATGGGTVAYEVGLWTGLQPSRRISSAIYDLATNADYGIGLPDRRVDLDGLRDRERTWDSRDRYEEDGITWKKNPYKDRLDVRVSDRKGYHDMNSEMARTGRSRVVYPSGVVTVVRDEPRPIPDGMFIGRNVVANSLEFDIALPTEDTPDHVLVQFYNEDFWDYDEVVVSPHFQYLQYQYLSFLGATAGKYSLTFKFTSRSAVSYTTAPLAYDASVATVQAALDALTCMNGTDHLVVEAYLTGIYKITYAGALATRNLPLLYVDNEVYGEDPIEGTLVSMSQTLNPDYPGLAPSRLLLTGITQRLQAWREGQYELGSVTHRRMLARFETDAEGYVPSYLSRIWLSHESGNWGQHGTVTGYEVTDTVTILTLSDPLDWTEEGQHVIQLRDNMGKPDPSGLYEVTKGPQPNQVTIAGTLTEAAEAYLHTEHQSGREATFFSFGIVDQHMLDLLVTGIRPTSKDRVGIEGYLYKEVGVYDADGDLDYTPMTEATTLAKRGLGPAVTNLFATLVITADSTKIVATWMPAPWASWYRVEASGDGGVNWKKMETTQDFKSSFDTFLPSTIEEVLLTTSHVHLPLNILSTFWARDTADWPDPWVVGAYNEKWVKFTSGVHKGRLYTIKESLDDYLIMYDNIVPRPLEADTYTIVEYVDREWLVGVRAGNEVFGERTVVKVSGVQAVYMGPGAYYGYPPHDPGAIPGDDIGNFPDTNVYRQDYYGNIFLKGKVFDEDHVTRKLRVGEELLYDADDASVAYLNYAPRAWSVGGDDGFALLLFLQDSLLNYKTSAPGEGEYTLTGATVQLGFDLEAGQHLHCIMIRADEDSGALDGIRVAEPVEFTVDTSDAVLHFTPVRPDELLLFLNGDCLFPVDAAPGPGEFMIVGTAITIGAVLSATDVLLCLGLADDRTMEADRFHCAKFLNSTLAFLPLWPEQCAVVERGTMRWNETGKGNFLIDQSVSPLTRVLWGVPEPVADTPKYGILMRAKA